MNNKVKKRKLVFEDDNPTGYARGAIKLSGKMIATYGYDKKQSMYIATFLDRGRFYRRTVHGLKAAVTDYVEHSGEVSPLNNKVEG